MRVATWNINGLRARLEFMALWLEARQPDIVGLQELKIPGDDFPHEFFNDLGYHALVYGQKSWNGVGILSKEPMELVQTGLPGEDDWGARLITAANEQLEFTTVYCPNGKTVEHDDYPNKLRWYESLAEHYRQSTHPHRVLCGDFNIVPDAIDSWRGAAAEGGIFHTPAERARLAALLEVGLVDLFRHKYPEEQAFSWWDYRGGAFHRKQGLRIDFVLGTPSLLPHVEDVVIDRDFRKKQQGLTASDHAPVYADLQLA
ncbi:MAG: exodeoxyribonuclease III [Pseudomonadales bacterium]